MQLVTLLLKREYFHFVWSGLPFTVTLQSALNTSECGLAIYRFTVTLHSRLQLFKLVLNQVRYHSFIAQPKLGLTQQQPTERWTRERPCELSTRLPLPVAQEIPSSCTIPRLLSQTSTFIHASVETPAFAMSFIAMVEAAAEAERQRRQAARAALAETPPLVEALSEDCPPPVVELSTATVPATNTRQQATSPRAVNYPCERQQDGQSTQTAPQACDAVLEVTHTTPQAHDALPEARVYISGKEKAISQILSSLYSSAKATGQDISTGQKHDAPQVPEQGGNAAKRAKLDTPPTPNGGGPQPARGAMAGAPPVRKDNITQPKAIVSKAIVPPAVVPKAEGSVVPKPILSPAPKGILPPIPRAILPPPPRTILPQPSKAILPPVSAILPPTAITEAQLPPTAVTKAVTPVTAVLEKNVSTRAIIKDTRRECAKQPDAFTLVVTTSENGGQSLTSKDDSGTQQQSQSAATAEQVNNAVQEGLISTIARQNGNTRSISEPGVKDKEQDGAPLQDKDNNQNPAALTAQLLSGLKVKKRKRPSKSMLDIDLTLYLR